MKYIFVCNYGLNRSPTAAEVAVRLAEERNISLEAGYLALYPEDTAEQEERERKRLESADKVFAMTSDIADVVKQRYKVPDEKIICLDIEDVYDISNAQMRNTLTEILEKKLEKWV